MRDKASRLVMLNHRSLCYRKAGVTTTSCVLTFDGNYIHYGSVNKYRN